MNYSLISSRDSVDDRGAVVNGCSQVERVFILLQDIIFHAGLVRVSRWNQFSLKLSTVFQGQLAEVLDKPHI